MKYFLKPTWTVLYSVIRMLMFLVVMFLFNPCIFLWNFNTNKCFGVRETFNYLNNDYKTVFVTEEPKFKQ